MTSPSNACRSGSRSTAPAWWAPTARRTRGPSDVTYLCTLPGFVVMAASDEAELMHMVATSAAIDDRPSAVRYPRGEGVGVELPERGTPLEIGKGRIVREGSAVALLSFGAHLQECLKAADELATRGLSTTVADARFAKPPGYGFGAPSGGRARSAGDGRGIVDRRLLRPSHAVPGDRGVVGSRSEDPSEWFCPIGSSIKARRTACMTRRNSTRRISSQPRFRRSAAKRRWPPPPNWREPGGGFAMAVVNALAIDAAQHDPTLERTIDEATRALIDLQRDDGHWCFELEARLHDPG